MYNSPMIFIFIHIILHRSLQLSFLFLYTLPVQPLSLLRPRSLHLHFFFCLCIHNQLSLNFGNCLIPPWFVWAKPQSSPANLNNNSNFCTPKSCLCLLNCQLGFNFLPMFGFPDLFSQIFFSNTMQYYLNT